MRFPSKFSIIGLGALATVQGQINTTTPVADAGDFGDITPPAWTYADTTWALQGMCGISNPNQSPINIVSASASSTPDATADATAFNFDAQGFPDSAISNAQQSELEVNGHTWEVAWDDHHNATDPYGINIGDKFYRLAQYHYHSPSEHQVDGQHYDMEAHHVHFCDGISCQTNNTDDEILVVAVFMNVGEPNTYLTSYWNDFSASNDVEIQHLGNPYTQFMPADKSYYSYVGSTTTPPCASNVQWLLLQNSVTMSQAQLTAYHNSVNTLPQPAVPAVPPPGVSAGWINSTKTNNRPVQALGTRVVTLYTQPPAVAAAEDPLNPQTVGGFPWLMVAVALLAAAFLIAGICLFLNQKPKAAATRAVKPKPRPPPQEETVPLMPAPQLHAPNLSMIVQPQPLMQAMPQQYSTVARPVAMAPYGQYGQSPMVLQP